MTYRDDKELLEAKNAELEAQLRDAEAHIAKLSGASSADDAPLDSEHSAVLGGPGRLHLSRDFDFEITTEGYEAIARVLEERLHVPVTQIGTTLASPGASFRLTQRDGRAHVSLKGDWSSLVGGWVVSSGLVGVFGGFVSAGLLHDLAHLTDGQAGMVLLASIPVVAALAAFLGRGRIQKQAAEKLRAHRGAMATILELAEQHRVRPKVRVSEEHSEEDEELEPRAAKSQREA